MPRKSRACSVHYKSIKHACVPSFVLPYFSYCSQVWYHCGRRNTEKLERANARALRFVYNDSDKISRFEALLGRIGSTSTLENRHTQDMLLTVNNIIQGSAPSSFKNLITEKRTAYDLRGNFTLSIPKVNTTDMVLSRGVMQQQSTGICYLVPWQAQNTLWLYCIDYTVSLLARGFDFFWCKYLF